ncbi:MAG: hypothetical protein OIN88_11355 [Candidatus Methanoperedens sp.]|nr:hypothetical protein [Candidatus Methanoperedens sp.]MCZ7359015.1 hypothetical protein [Candidatus Methanoperedens sp.]HLB71821.1 hypothetical protein [Candidatus Methanoperedens sp.]
MQSEITIKGFSMLLSIWVETRIDGDTLKIRKKGVKCNGGNIFN